MTISGVIGLRSSPKACPHTSAHQPLDVAMKTVIQPLSDADGGSSAVYAALDDPGGDWSKAVMAMLNRGAIEHTGEQAIERFKFMQRLEERFDAEMKERKKSDEEEEPGIGNRG